MRRAGRQQVAVACDAVQARAAALAARPRRRLRDQLRRRGLSRIRRAGRGAVPARPARGRTSVPAPIVVATRDPAAIAVARSVLGGGRAPTSEQSLEAMRKVVAQLRDVERDRRAGEDRRHRAAAIATDPVRTCAADCRRRRHRRPPRHAGLRATRPRPRRRGAARADCAVAARGASAGRRCRRSLGCRRRRAAGRYRVQSVRPGSRVRRARRSRARCQPSSPTSSRRPSRPRCRALLLLALDVSSGPEAIEAAPPLGSRAEVVAILRGVIADLAIDADASRPGAPGWIGQSGSRAARPGSDGRARGARRGRSRAGERGADHDRMAGVRAEDGSLRQRR